MKVGQHVVCVKDFSDEMNGYRVQQLIVRGCSLPTKGTVYTLRTVESDATVGVGVRLEEIANPAFEWSNGITAEPGFAAHRFRPLQKLKVEDFLEVKAPKELT